MSRLGRGKTTDEHAEDSNRRCRHARNAKRLSESIRADLTQALNNLAGKAGHAIERKIRRDSTTFVLATPLDFALLASQIACVLHGSLGRRDVERRIPRVDFEAGKSLVRDQVREANLRLPKQLARRNAGS